MLTSLLIEMLLACALVVFLGYLLDGRKGLAILGSAVLVANLVTLASILLIRRQGLLPLHHLNPAWKFPTIYLGNTYILLEIAIWSYVLSGALGYFLDKWMGTLILETATVIATLICFVFSLLPSVFYELPGTLTLLTGIIVVGTIGVSTFSKMILKGKGFWAVSSLWFGFCTICWVAYWAAGRIGLLFISLPTLAIFWVVMYHLSQYILPLQQGQRLQAFRSLLTFALGTNYPFYAIGDWKKQETQEQDKPLPCVPGNPFGQFFAGPGIVLSACDHLAVTTNGVDYRIRSPGLNFTGQFEELYADVDLRPQLRTTTIKAETKDGIGVSIFTFMPHRIGAGGRLPELGKSYPFDRAAVQQAVCQHAFVDHEWQRDDNSMAIERTKRIPWDELILMMGPPILKSIAVNYTCNELHAPGDPRAKIAGELRSRLREVMKPLGIEMVGGGISDIVPPEDVVEQRIKNWEAKYKRKIEIEYGKAEAHAALQLEPIWAEAQLGVMSELAEILDKAGQVTEETLAFQLIEALSEPGEFAETRNGHNHHADPEDVLTRLLLMRRMRWLTQN